MNHRKRSPVRPIDGLLEDLDFMMSSDRPSTRALKYAFFACVAWLALSLAAMLGSCSA